MMNTQSRSGDLSPRPRTRCLKSARGALALPVCRDGAGKAEATPGIRGAEVCDLRDLRTAQSDNFDGVRHEGLRLLVPDVGAECELPIRASWDEAPAFRTCQHQAAKEHSDLFASLVPGGYR